MGICHLCGLGLSNVGSIIVSLLNYRPSNWFVLFQNVGGGANECRINDRLNSESVGNSAATQELVGTGGHELCWESPDCSLSHSPRTSSKKSRWLTDQQLLHVNRTSHQKDCHHNKLNVTIFSWHFDVYLPFNKSINIVIYAIAYWSSIHTGWKARAMCIPCFSGDLAFTFPLSKYCKSICAQTNGHATNNPTWLEFMTLFPPSPNHPQLSLTLPRKHGFRKIEPTTCVRLNIRSFHLNTTYSNISASLVITINHSGKGAENALDE